MDRALFVVDTSETGRELLREAGELAAGVGADIVLLNVTDENDYESELRLNAHSGKKTSSIDDIEAELREEAERLAEAELADIDVDHSAVGVLGNVPADVLEQAEELDCDHIFVTGGSRSPIGKAMFGDEAQSVVLNFDGPVTIRIALE